MDRQTARDETSDRRDVCTCVSAHRCQYGDPFLVSRSPFSSGPDLVQKTWVRHKRESPTSGHLETARDGETSSSSESGTISLLRFQSVIQARPVPEPSFVLTSSFRTGEVTWRTLEKGEVRGNPRSTYNPFLPPGTGFRVSLMPS